MTTVFAFSDTHGATIDDRILSIMKESNVVVFCGDGYYGINRYLDEGLSAKLLRVAGNCDPFGQEEIITELGGVKTLITHGHLHGVKTDLLNLALYAKEKDCELVLYGHTHAYSDTTYDGVRLINTGSMGADFAGENGYVYLVINNKNIFAKFVKIG